ncbi:M43 family zinc metalloprotease [Dyadobacter sp. CY312]|uniref:M43 family zinc metalloprotease n=1 Tax=Dyadobacter sp. CY312 TaxID=2907303 RepID=UPI001EEE4C13|nr:M43 family zinc metalloprotease [Dyadobacter sp. CY312]MCE7039331.1 T9SS type A sorting domain-containing protein [Dyadobacter sp. CY312]
MLAITANAQRSDSDLKRCATAELDSIRTGQNPELLLRRQKAEEVIQEHIHRHNARIRTSAEAVITIPVVVHIVHNRSDNRIGGLGNSNISEEQIQSQIDVLNEDYSNTSGRKGFYTDSLSVDTGIRFRLAGIVRNSTRQENFDYRTADKQLAALSPPWATNRYLNIWVCNFSSEYLGMAQMPSIAEANGSTPGLRVGDEEDSDPLTDGAIIDWRYFGRDLSGETSGIYNLGRTTTHEVGHWLGLLHIWGNRTCGTDYCDDTPRARDRNLSTDLNCEAKYSNCDGPLSRDMIENYMDYSPDACMSVFTNDQKNRMHAVLAVSPRRAQLVEHIGRSESNLVVDLYPNPVEGYLNTNIYSPGYAGFEISVFNNSGVEMLKGAYNQTYINVKNFPAGVYFLKVTTDKETVTKRFLVR